jgi:hypothetical protein
MTGLALHHTSYIVNPFELLTVYLLPLHALALCCRWAHKSFVDPNYVAAYSIHEGGVLLPGGGVDSQHAVSSDCVFGLHLVNMLAFRMYGAGLELHWNGTRFSMASYVQSAASLPL